MSRVYVKKARNKKAFKVKFGEKIPLDKVKKPSHSNNKSLVQRSNLGKTLRGVRK